MKTMETTPARAPSPVNVIETEGLWRRFEGHAALRDLTLRVPRGGVHALVGRNGAGKTTLVRLLLGFLTPSAGSCRVLGADSRALTPEVRGRVGYVNEEHALPAWMTVGGLLDVQRPLYPRWSEATFREVAASFRLEPARRVATLSRGERAGLSLALALAQGPELLLLDEPTLGLDAVARQAVVEALLFAGGRDSMTVVYSSHHLDEVERVADRLLVLSDGTLALDATPEELVERVRGFLVDSLPPLPPGAIPGLLRSREIEGQTELVVRDPGADLRERLLALGARGIHPLPLAFDRAVNALLAGDAGRSRP